MGSLFGFKEMMKMNMETHLDNNDFTEITDLSLASTLYYFGCKIESVNKNNPSRCIFIFQKSRDLDTLIKDFWSNSLQVEPQAYFSSLREVKTRLYQS